MFGNVLLLGQYACRCLYLPKFELPGNVRKFRIGRLLLGTVLSRAFARDSLLGSVGFLQISRINETICNETFIMNGQILEPFSMLVIALPRLPSRGVQLVASRVASRVDNKFRSKFEGKVFSEHDHAFGLKEFRYSGDNK